MPANPRNILLVGSVQLLDGISPISALRANASLVAALSRPRFVSSISIAKTLHSKVRQKFVLGFSGYQPFETLQ